MFVSIDIGNTYVAMGIFLNEELKKNILISTQLQASADEYALKISDFFSFYNLDVLAVKKCAIASVVPGITGILKDAIRIVFGFDPLIIDSGVKTGIKIKFENPKEIGADRIAHAVAAKALYTLPAIILDFSTALAFDAVSAQGEFLGGAIVPSPLLALESLSHKAARIKTSELKKPENVIGKTTEEALRSGIVFGYVGLIQGLLARLETELGSKACIIATGPFMDPIAEYIKEINFTDPSLTLKGIRLIAQMNKCTE